MRIRFNGMIATKHSGGCSCRGTSGSTSRVFLTHKTFILPSGLTRSFSIGDEYEVSDVDGNFLLSYSQTDKDGVRQESFTRIG